MKKIIIVVFILILTGCSETTEINFGIDGHFLSDSDGSGGDSSFVDMYPSFQDMLDGKWAKFYYGEVVRIEERNMMVDTMYFEVIKSEDGEILGEINVSVNRGQTRLKIGSTAVLYLDYDEEYSYYSPASPYKGTFMISGDEVYFSKEHQELYNEIGNSKEELFKIIFK